MTTLRAALLSKYGVKSLMKFCWGSVILEVYLECLCADTQAIDNTFKPMIRFLSDRGL